MTPERISDDKEKIEAYFQIIESRIFKPLNETTISDYCTATLLLLFAVIDGLGKLLHENDKALPGQRFQAFLDYMGGRIFRK